MGISLSYFLADHSYLACVWPGFVEHLTQFRNLGHNVYFKLGKRFHLFDTVTIN